MVGQLGSRGGDPTCSPNLLGSFCSSGGGERRGKKSERNGNEDGDRDLFLLDARVNFVQTCLSYTIRDVAIASMLAHTHVVNPTFLHSPERFYLFTERRDVLESCQTFH